MWVEGSKVQLFRKVPNDIKLYFFFSRETNQVTDQGPGEREKKKKPTRTVGHVVVPLANLLGGLR